MVKNQPANAVYTGDTGSVPGSGRSPGGENDNHSSILAGQFLGQRSLAGYIPWSLRESDTTERLTLSLSKSSMSLSEQKSSEFGNANQKWLAMLFCRN